MEPLKLPYLLYISYHVQPTTACTFSGPRDPREPMSWSMLDSAYHGGGGHHVGLLLVVPTFIVYFTPPRKILRVSWTAKKTNEWLLNKAGVKRQLLDAVELRKLAYYGHIMRKQGNCLER